MEKEGLSRAIEFLSDNSLDIQTLVTNRHKQIVKFISDKHPTIKHHYDVWHVCEGMLTNLLLLYTHVLHACTYKGIKKKLTKLGNYKDCSIINNWTKSITNHMYWCAASAPDGDGELRGNL